MPYTLRRKLFSWLTDIDVRGVRAVAHVLPKLLIPSASQPSIIRTNYGFDIEIDPKRDQGLYSSLQYTGVYEKGTLEMMAKLLRPGDHFIDAGANIGLMSLHAAQIVGATGKVWAVEPNPSTAEILMRNCTLNRLTSIALLHFALGNSTGQVVMAEDFEDRGSATLLGQSESDQSFAVEIKRLDDVFADRAKPIRLIKLDIEGYELEALKGGRALISADQPALIVEISSLRANAESASPEVIYAYLKELGFYRLFRLKGTKLRKSGLMEIKSPAEMPEHDNIFCLNGEQVRDLRI